MLRASLPLRDALCAVVAGRWGADERLRLLARALLNTGGAKAEGGDRKTRGNGAGNAAEAAVKKRVVPDTTHNAPASLSASSSPAAPGAAATATATTSCAAAAPSPARVSTHDHPTGAASASEVPQTMHAFRVTHRGMIPGMSPEGACQQGATVDFMGEVPADVSNVELMDNFERPPAAPGAPRCLAPSAARVRSLEASIATMPPLRLNERPPGMSAAEFVRQSLLSHIPDLPAGIKDTLPEGLPSGGGGGHLTLADLNHPILQQVVDSIAAREGAPSRAQLEAALCAGLASLQRSPPAAHQGGAARAPADDAREGPATTVNGSKPGDMPLPARPARAGGDGEIPDKPVRSEDASLAGIQRGLAKDPKNLAAIIEVRGWLDVWNVPPECCR